MVPRRVIADSDEEDDDDFDSPLKPAPTTAPQHHHADAEVEAPEMEPLSPVHQIGDALLHHHEFGQQQQRTSGSTDTTFFENIHDEHRLMAQQQQQQQRSNLVENIVRMSQKASGGTSSSGDNVSLPPKTGGKPAKSSNVSSATDVTSPAVQLALKKQQENNKGAAVTTLSGKPVSNASEITTPRKSDGKDEWDVPSSGDEARSTRSAKSGGGSSATKTYGKRKRGSVSKASAAAARDLFNAGPAEELEVAEVDRSSSDWLPAAKKGKMAEIASLTASQKEQYTRVHVSSSDDNSGRGGSGGEVAAPDYSMAPPPASKPKSSCATTIAYSTPSRYASSGPRPPWELAQPALEDDEPLGIEDNQEGPEITENIVDLTSSPDIITSASSRWRGQPASTGKPPKLPRQLSRVDEEGVQPIGRSPSPKRQKKSKRRSDDDDELAGDEGWDSEDVGFHREVYKPRPSRRRSNGAKNNVGAAEAATDDDVIQDIPPTQDPHQPAITTTEAEREILETPDIAAKAPDPPPVMVGGKPPPKKRGRKKKQPVQPSASDELTQAQTPSVLGVESGAVEAEPTAAPAAADPYAVEDDAPVEKPKKKRGRPRKSDTPVKAAELCSIRTENNTLPSTADPLAMDEDIAPETTERSARRSATRKASEPDATTHGSASPLQEVDRNTKHHTPPAVAAAEASESESSSTTTKKPAAIPAAASSAAKKTTNPATPSQQQPGKPGYRVGLSKKSRVASLLKIIRK
ncbi:hypothetical protein PG994_001338 [Apiospora phragmitis]|uniref:AT hook domain-containing protein n=1 Tax=Apiospora phragmitis TaxID=2905665 RepID=A0ABR1WT83_9PEZI